MKNLLYFFGMVLLLASCSEEKKQRITNTVDYDSYLVASNRPAYSEAKNEVEFWSKRLRPDSSGVGDLGPLAAAYTSLFETTGKIDYLRNAETLYIKALDISANNKDIYARSLAHNYIAQHRFREAAELLETSYTGISSKKATELMLFDVNMELGKYDEAETFLNKVRNTSDYNYLIRKAKWSDYKGNLDDAIKYMEKARDIAESRDSKSLKIWTYSNLGDFYGHAGRIADAYAHYLKTLELQPDNAYAKKGIAWIVYAYEENPEEARRILDSVMLHHQAPDYYLLLSEIAENEGDEVMAGAWMSKFRGAIANPLYGSMYFTHFTEVLVEEEPARALELAKQEVGNRATPETYVLLAVAELSNGNTEKALEIIEQEVEGKTYEPMAAYYSAQVYKAAGAKDKVAAIKADLEEASFEIGPVLAKKVADL